MTTDAAPPYPPAGDDHLHDVRNALTPVLARIQLARRCLHLGDLAAADAHLAAAVRHVHGAVAPVDGGHPRDG